MKNYIVGIGIVLVLGAAGFVGYRYLTSQASPSQAPASGSVESTTDTVTGLLKPGKGDDYSYILITDSGKTVGIASQTTDLAQYVNKRIEITGSYSGTTLYAYTITEKE